MNWDAVGAINETIGVLAIVATLIYFARQISQANSISTATGARELQQQYTHVYTLIATNSEIRGLVTRLKNPSYIVQSEEEQEQIDSFVPLLAGIWLTTAIAHEQGLIDPYMYRIYCEDVDVKLTKWPGLKPHLVTFAKSYASTKEYDIFHSLYS
ncbi:MAG: hypothetical protein V7459_11535 [Oceanicoccus sp.]